MSTRLGPILIHLRHASPTLIERFQQANLLVWQSSSVPPIDASRPPLVIVSDSEVPHSFPDGTRDLLQAAIETGETAVLRIGQGDRNERDVAEVTLPLSVSERELVQSCLLLAEIATLRQAKRAMSEAKNRWHELAMIDQLTELPNRRSWDAELRRRSELGQGFCMGIIDLDFFKRINDRSGHNVGDAVLKETARIMRGELRRSDFLARLGGDEFGILLGPLKREIAQTVFDRLRKTVSIRLQEARLPSTTLSAGCVVIDSGKSIDTSEAYAVAARSLQSAKQSDRNQTIARHTTS